MGGGAGSKRDAERMPSLATKGSACGLVLLLVLSLATAATTAIQPSWYTPPKDWEPDATFSSTLPLRESDDPEHGENYHKPMFPLDWTDYAGLISCSLGLMLAAGGGIGGGGMLVPLFVLVMGFSPKHAIPLSNVTVFGGSLSNYFLNQPKRHPECNRPLIDWDLILVMQPMTLAGALLGSFINKLLPELFLTVSLVTLLVYTCKETLEKGFRAYAAESKAKEKAAAAARESELSRLARAGDELTGDEKQALMAEERAEAGGAGLAAGGAGGGYSSGSARELEAMLQEETIVPWWKVGALWAVFGAVILVNLLKGGGGFPSPVGISCGSTGYWASTAAMFAWILIVSYFVREYLIDITARRRRIGYRYQAGDIRWDERATVVYPLICIVAGMCAGMFGIGGGIVQVPLMLHLGVNPKVASATSATMIMFTSFTALTSFYVFGLLLEDYAAVGFVMGLGVTVLGQVGLNMLIKKLGRDSLIVFSVAAVVGVSAMLMGTHSLISVSSKAVDLSIGQVCDAGEPGSE